MPTSGDPLQELRDVHLPDPISLWPLAWGWWMVLGLVVFGVIVFMWIRSYRRRTHARRLALLELGIVQNHYRHNQDDQWAVGRLSEIVRRLALATFPRTEVAGLVGNAWLRFLDEVGQTNQFTQGVGSLLSVGPYQQQALVSATDLMSLVEKWIQHVSPSSRRNTP